MGDQLNLKFLALLTRDQDSRERNEPFSQMKNYLNFKQDLSLGPNRPYNAPTFYLHLGNRVANATHTQEFTPSFTQHFQFTKLSMKLHRQSAEITGFGKHSVEYKIHRFDVKPYRLGGVCTMAKIDWDGHRIAVNGNGKIYDYNARRNVKVLLNGEHISSNLKITKLRISNKKPHPEVLALFGTSFMASGHIELGEEHVCKLHEMPGSYCTEDFECDTNFRALLRRCQLPKRLPREDVIPIPAYQNLLRHLVAKLENTDDRRIEMNMVHHEHNTLLLAICPYFSSFFRIFHCYSQFETRNYLPEKSMWSAREKLVYLSWRLENEVVCRKIYQKWEDQDFKTKCEKDRQCLYVRRLIRLGAFLSEHPYDTRMPESVLAEFMFQIHTALTALWNIINDKGSHKNRMLGETCKMLVSFQHLYQSSPENILHAFPYLRNNDSRRIFLDVVLAKANEHVFNEAIHVYRDYPEIVLKSLMKHPNLVLFGIDKIRLPPRLLEGFASWLESRNGSSRRKRYLLLAELTASKRPSEEVQKTSQVPTSSGVVKTSAKEPEVIELSEDEEPPVIELSDSDDEPEVTFQRCGARGAQNEQVEQEQRGEVHMEQQDAPTAAKDGSEHAEQNDALLNAPGAQQEDIVLLEHPVNAPGAPEEPTDAPAAPTAPKAAEEHTHAPTTDNELAEQHDAHQDAPTTGQNGSELAEQLYGAPKAPELSTDAPTTENADNELAEQSDAHLDAPSAQQEDIVLSEHPVVAPGAPEQSAVAPTTENADNELAEQNDAHQDAPTTEQEESVLLEHPATASEDSRAPGSPRDAPEQQDAHLDAPSAQQEDFVLLDPPVTAPGAPEAPDSPTTTEEPIDAPSQLAEQPVTAPTAPDEPTDALSSEQDKPEQHDAPTSEREGNEQVSPAPTPSALSASFQDAPEQDESELMEQHDAPGPSSAPGAIRNLFGRPRTPKPEESEDAPEDAPEEKPTILKSPVRKRKLNLLDLVMSPMRSMSPEYKRPRLPPPPEVVTPQRRLRGKIESPQLLKVVFKR